MKKEFNMDSLTNERRINEVSKLVNEGIKLSSKTIKMRIKLDEMNKHIDKLIFERMVY